MICYFIWVSNHTQGFCGGLCCLILLFRFRLGFGLFVYFISRFVLYSKIRFVCFVIWNSVFLYCIISIKLFHYNYKCLEHYNSYQRAYFVYVLISFRAFSMCCSFLFPVLCFFTKQIKFYLIVYYTRQRWHLQ